MEEIIAEFELKQPEPIEATFSIEALQLNHDVLVNRDLPNQHPISAITGLEEALSQKESEISEIQQALETETQTREQADSELSDRIEDNKTNIENLVARTTQNESDISTLNEIKADKSELETEKTNRENADKQLQDNIDTLEDDLTEDIDALSNIVDSNYTTLDGKIDSNVNTLNTRITNVADELGQTIEENVVALQNEDSRLQNQINAHSSTLTEHDTRITNNANAITQEIADRQNADDTLQEQIDNLKARGRYLSLWNATTGLAETNPETSPYDYKAGDYFIVGTVGETNYKPVGTQYIIGQASTEIETEELATEDVYYFDGSVWHLQVNHGKTVSFANLAGQPSDNTALKNVLDGKQPVGDYATKTELSTGLAEKQDTLISGTSIKTINNTSILGSGNIEIQGGGTWGTITGDITAQTDLQNALDEKQPAGDYATKTELDTKANDSDVVHKAGDETVTGVKTFAGGAGGSTTNVSIQTKNALAIGDATQTSYTGIYNHRKCADDGNKVNTAGFLVNKDGTTKFNHKTGTTSAAGTSDDYSIVFGKGKLVYGDGKNGEVYHDIFKDDTNYSKLETNNKQIIGAINELKGKVEEIELFKFPNAIIAGEPNIDHGQVSDFSNANFLQFPFLVDLTNRRFRADFCFTTGDDVTTQQNVLDSEFGLALAIKNGKGLMAIGHNGTSWAGQVVGSINIQPRTTYYAKLSWNRMNYQTQLSTNGTDYTPDMNFGSTQSPYPRTMFIGGSPDLFGPGTAHPFKGSINLNFCFLYIEDQLVWQGMDDAGLATRADISLDNLDAAGQAKFDAKQDTLVSGTNIKTINNESILGEGNIEIKGGGDVPDNVFTTDNLKGGKGIEIVKSGTIEKETINIGRFDMGHLEIQNTQQSVATTSFDIAFYFTTGAYFNQYERIWMDASRQENQESSQIALWEGNYCFNLRGENDLTLHKVITNPLILTKYAIRAKLTEDGIITLYNKIGTWEGDWNIVEQFGANPEQYIFSNDLWGCGLRLQDYYSQCIFNGTINRTLSYITINGVEVFGETNEGEIVGNPTLTTEIVTIEGEGDGYVINAIGGGFDFEGTLAEYEEAQPTLAEDAKCLVTDDVGSIPTEITAEQLNDKADRNLSNCTRPYVVEQYDDGDGNGYRVWSNKFCEQWGRVNYTESSTGKSVNLYKEYRDILYYCSASCGEWAATWTAEAMVRCIPTSTTAISIQSGATRQGLHFWTTKGYIL